MTMQSEQIDKLAEALAKAQGTMSQPKRNKEVKVKTSGGDGYSFKYATLDAIIEAVKEPLATNGLAFLQILANGDGKYRLVTKLVHSSGQWIASETPILATTGKNQEFGSALTFMKRYALAAMLGVAADEDDDANAADGNTVESSKERAPAMKAKLAEATKPPAMPPIPDPLRIRATEIADAIKAAPTADKKRRIIELNREDVAALDQIDTRYGDRLRDLANLNQKEAA